MLENRQVIGPYYPDEEYDDEPDASEMSLILEAIDLGEWSDHYPTVQIAYEQAREANGEEMERVFHQLRKEARDAAGDLLDQLEDIAWTPAEMRKEWLE